MMMDRTLREKETSPLEVTRHDIFKWGKKFRDLGHFKSHLFSPSNLTCNKLGSHRSHQYEGRKLSN